MQKKCKKMQKGLHISKKSTIFAADLGKVPSVTLKHNKGMARKNALNALGEKERKLVLPLGKKSVRVYEIVSGIGHGMGVVQCSLYPDLAGVFPTMEKAIERAHRIKSFHERQLTIQNL